MTYRYWPLFDLRLSTPDLVLRPMAEADLAAIADLLPDDVEMDPALPAYELEDPRLGRGIQSHQIYWKSLGTWCPRAWRLGFVVRSTAGEIVGVQRGGSPLPHRHVALRPAFTPAHPRPALPGRRWRQTRRKTLTTRPRIVASSPSIGV